MNRWSHLAVLVVALGGCTPGGQYGYADHYIPLREERAHLAQAQEAVFNEVRTDPMTFQNRVFSWFGVVEQIQPGEAGASLVRLSYRNHQERHLCTEEERNTCRVTVSQASSGTFTAQVTLRPGDAAGQNRVAPGSLLRVYCQVTGEYDAEGGPLLRCDYYRHWPRGQWAHTGMRGQMRR
jgi:hypothetical protein